MFQQSKWVLWCIALLLLLLTWAVPVGGRKQNRQSTVSPQTSLSQPSK